MRLEVAEATLRCRLLKRGLQLRLTSRVGSEGSALEHGSSRRKHPICLPHWLLGHKLWALDSGCVAGGRVTIFL